MIKQNNIVNTKKTLPSNVAHNINMGQNYSKFVNLFIFEQRYRAMAGLNLRLQTSDEGTFCIRCFKGYLRYKTILCHKVARDVQLISFFT